MLGLDLKRFLRLNACLFAATLVIGINFALVHHSLAAEPSKKTPISRAKPVAKSSPAKAIKSKSIKSKLNSTKIIKSKPKKAARNIVPPRPSYGQIAGLHSAYDALDLRSSVAFVIDQDTNEVLIQKNDKAVLPIASITKLMTGVLVSEARLPLDEIITITQDDVDTEKGSTSRLKVGAQLSRGELLHLALMASENRAAHALGRTYPGGIHRFVALMNSKAESLGMMDTSYVEPTGLSSRNQSSARDLATLVSFAYKDANLRELSTSPNHRLAVGRQTLQFSNTNRLVNNPKWDIGIQKTGYISEAGQCLVMQAKIAGRKLIMVFLDSTGKLSRIADAERVRRWVESGNTKSLSSSPLAAAAGSKLVTQIN